MSDDLIPPESLVRKRRRARARTSPRQLGIPRKRTVATKSLTRSVIAAGWRELGGDRGQVARPRTRDECPAARPCPFVGCRHHLYLEVNQETGSITINRPDLEPHELESSCSLDVAENGGHTLDQVGQILNISRERVRQLETRVIVGKLKGSIEIIALGLDGPIG